MIYRTVTVTATLTDGRVTVTPTLTTVEAEGTLAERVVNVDAGIVGSVIEAEASVSGNISAEAELITNVHSSGDYDPYTGETEVTPTQDTQTLNTSGKVLLTNITINPIPSNYGLITWNGATLTVS